jgi:hypothetical protein
MHQVRRTQSCHQVLEGRRIKKIDAMPGESVVAAVAPGNAMHFETPGDEQLADLPSDKSSGAR